MTVNITIATAAKLASIVVLCQVLCHEALSEDFDTEALRVLLADENVLAFVRGLGPLAPVLRKPQ